MSRLPQLAASRQRGVAALAVVMVLFFVLSLAAAYTNRNLIFEQRTSANFYRATQSFEVAQAGMDWALAMLNGGRIDNDCQPSTTLANRSFRERYVNIDVTSGMLSPVTIAGVDLGAACVFNGADWNCKCPANAAPVPVAPGGAGPFPAYKVRFRSFAAIDRPGLIRVEVLGCPRLDLAANGCLDFAAPDGSEGRQFMSALIGLNSALKAVPAAALTARGAISAAGSTVSAYNDDFGSGVAVQSGGPVTGVTFNGVAGSPRSNALVENDTSLAGMAASLPLLPTAADRMFASYFGLTPDDYRTQPAAYVLNCPCTAAQVRSAIVAQPFRPLWLAGDLTIDSAGDIGSAAQPVMMVVTGSISATASATIFGTVYSRASPWSLSGNFTVRGAAVAESGLDGAGGAQFIYNGDLMRRLRLTTGSWARLPASWKDYPL